MEASAPSVITTSQIVDSELGTKEASKKILKDLPLPEKSFYAGGNISSRERFIEEIFALSIVPNTKSAVLAARL